MSRVDALKLAQWRTKVKAAGGGFCRLCGGKTQTPAQPYCLRHFRLLGGYPEIKAAVRQGERLADADGILRLLARWRGLYRVNEYHLELGPYLIQFKNTDHVWSIRHETHGELARVPSILAAAAFLEERAARVDGALSVHSRAATKKLIL